MSIRIGIVGFGRIGRAMFRLGYDRPELEFAVICDDADPASLTYLLNHSTTEGAFEALCAEIAARANAVQAPELRRPARLVTDALDRAGAWLGRAMANRDTLEAGARRFALTLGRSAELALLTEHAQWCLDHERGPRAAAIARRFASHGVDLIEADEPMTDARDAALILQS